MAAHLSARFEIRVEAPDFLRVALTRQDDGLLVDLVRERVRQFQPEKPVIEGIAVDPPEEILANKLTALVGRQEERDLVDVFRLEKAGYELKPALEAALQKDGGCTPATLAWLLSEIRIPDDAVLPGDTDPAELRAYIADLVVRLRRVAAPQR